MISNPTIMKKLEEKTAGDTATLEILKQMLENESEHKQYNKLFRSLIEEDVKRGSHEVR